MRKIIDLIGQRFGRLLVTKKVEKLNLDIKDRRTYWLCKCDCGNEKIIVSSSLIRGLTVSCGCYAREKSSKRLIKDLTGQRFGRLIVISQAGRTKTQQVIWYCICDCGNKVEIRSQSLINSRTQSCGCLSESFIASEIKKYFVKEYNAETEYKILKNPNTRNWLRYDIYIPKGENPKISGIYVEINGEQHYNIHRWHKRMAKRNNTTPEQEFQYQKSRDKLKKKFAKENGVYIEIDLRKIEIIKEAIENIEDILQIVS